MNKTELHGCLAGHKGESGIGLLEVVIYAALSLILLTLAVMGIGGMQKKAYRSQEMARMHNDADEAIRLMAQDARNLGLKRIVYSPSPGSLVDTALTGMQFSVNDSSAFVHREGNPYDSLRFLKPRLNAIGRPIAIDTILYAVNPSTKTLYRSVNGVGAVEMGRQIDALQFEYGVTATKTVLFNMASPNVAQWTQNPGGVLGVTGTSMRARANAAGVSTFWYSQAPVTLNAKHTYELDMLVAGSKSFLSEVDSLRAILCNAAGTPLASQRFLPANTMTPLTLEWSGIACSNCYVGFRMHMGGAGEFTWSGLKLTNTRQADGVWAQNPTLAQKKGVRAFRVYLLTRSKQGFYGLRQDTVTLANVNLTFNDNLGRSLLEDVISIPNNGY